MNLNRRLGIYLYLPCLQGDIMTTFIGMEYLAALALIKLDKEEISLSELNQFRVKVVKKFTEQKISSLFLFSENYALDMVRNYSDCFELTENDTRLRRKVEPCVLISKFIAYLSNDIIKAAYAVKESAA